jgi:hypothetical protein
VAVSPKASCAGRESLIDALFAGEPPRLTGEPDGARLDRRSGHQQVHRAQSCVLGAKLGGMTTREKARKLLDELPESEIEPVVEFMVSRGKDPVLHLLENAPEEDEEISAEEEAAVQEARDELAAGAPTIPLEQVMRELGDA